MRIREMKENYVQSSKKGHPGSFLSLQNQKRFKQLQGKYKIVDSMEKISGLENKTLKEIFEKVP